jgi:hypothetical protein
MKGLDVYTQRNDRADWGWEFERRDDLLGGGWDFTVYLWSWVVCLSRTV